MKIGDANQFWWWYLKTFCVSISLPWLIYRAVKARQFKCGIASLKDKVVVITGASSGIGEAAVHKFYERGCKVVLLARRIDELNRVKNELIAKNNGCSNHVPVVMQLDITNTNSISEVVSKIIDIYGQIDILVNNAGVSFRGVVVDTDIDVYTKVMQINFIGQIAITKAVLPHMIKRQTGHVVFMSSAQAKIVLPCRSAYGASKHALEAFAVSLRSEIQKYNVNVSLVSPSYVKTSLSLNALTSRGNKYGQMDNTQKKGVSPSIVAEDVIDAVIFNKKEIIRSPFLHVLFMYIKVLIPSLYYKIISYFEKDMVLDMQKK